MDEIIASAGHGIRKEDFAQYYDTIVKQKKRRSKLFFDLFFGICGAVFIVCCVMFFITEKKIDPPMVIFSVTVIVLVVLHFLRAPMAKKRFVEFMYGRINANIKENDHTDFYRDRYIIHISDSSMEILYSDITDITETDSAVFLTSRADTLHTVSKDRFISGSFEKVRNFIADNMK